jgi:4-hydroxy-3-polyprenylbenzoate decarboxylase
MGYRNLQEVVRDLDRTRSLVRIGVEIDPRLEAAAIHRRVYAAGGPALLFERVKGCRFPLLSNLFGTSERTRYLFRDTLDGVRQLVELKADPTQFLRRPWRYRRATTAAWSMRPKLVRSRRVLNQRISLAELPQVVSWPNDGGPFITLPEVYTEDCDAPGLLKSNLGMYRVQLAGNDYGSDEVGLHYQIHRSVGIHHAKAIRRGEPFRVNIFVGGAPAMILAAVMPLPEGLSELMFAGALGGHRIPMIAQPDGRPAIYAEADFCITGTVLPATKPEGPFGDHLGYYSLKHDFPVLKLDGVYHRPDAIWPFTVVGRPPQEDTAFGEIIHELTGPAIPTVLPGVHAVHAVDAAGVHPLLLAIGSERYVPYAGERRPQELLTIANAILGQGQLSLAKYLLIVAKEDEPNLDVNDVPAFFRHLLSRINWARDLHFQTRTTIDTLDYSGTGLNEGSKVVMAAAGPVRRSLPTEVPASFRLPEGFADPRIVLPGVVAVTGPNYQSQGRRPIRRFCEELSAEGHPVSSFPLIVIVDDSRFVAESLNNFLWVTFTRSNPAADIDGVGAFVEDQHWGCTGPLVIDARIKTHHAPPLEEDLAVTRRVESLAVPGGPLHGLY